MKFLRITAVNGTRKYIGDAHVITISTTADTQDAGTLYSAPKVVRGRINEVKYQEGGGGGGSGSITTTAVSEYTTGGILYEYGCFTVDGAFVTALSNAI
jgi:hypothetical protein